MDSEEAAGMPVNLGDPRELRVKDLADQLLEMTGAR